MKNLLLSLALIISANAWADDDILNLNCLLKGEHTLGSIDEFDVMVNFNKKTVDGLLAYGDGWYWSQLELVEENSNTYVFHSRLMPNKKGGLILKWNNQTRYILNRSNGFLQAQVWMDRYGWEKHFDYEKTKMSFVADCAKVNSKKLF